MKCDNPDCENEFEPSMSADLSPSDVPQFSVTWYDPDAEVYPDGTNPMTGVYKTDTYCSLDCLVEVHG